MHDSSGCCVYLSKPAIRGALEQPHVLLVDDCEITRRLIELLFKECQCRVITASSGLEALDYLGLRDDPPREDNVPKMRMICTDYDMPGMNGLELLKKIKECPILVDVPIAIMASDNDPLLIDKCVEAGAVMFVPKPVKLSDVEKLKKLMI